MKIDRKNFHKEEKKLKKYYKEQAIYEKILIHIKSCPTYAELSTNPISYMYGFEPLKHELKGYYSFNLTKKGGVIRLIISIDKENNIVILECIDMDHYNEWKRKIKEKVEI